MPGLFLALMLGAHLQTPLPDGVVYRSHPATLQEMRWLEGRWWNKHSDNGTIEHPEDWVRLRPIEPGWLSIRWIDKAVASIDNGEDRAPVTSYGGNLYVHIDICAALGKAADPVRCFYHGQPCQYPLLLKRYPDGTVDVEGIDRVKTHAANPWLRSAPPPTEELFDDTCDGALFGMGVADERRFIFVPVRPDAGGRFRKLPPEMRAATSSPKR